VAIHPAATAAQAATAATDRPAAARAVSTTKPLTESHGRNGQH
jgi:hypothetical protein